MRLLNHSPKAEKTGQTFSDQGIFHRNHDQKTGQKDYAKLFRMRFALNLHFNKSNEIPGIEEVLIVRRIRCRNRTPAKDLDATVASQEKLDAIESYPMANY